MRIMVDIGHPAHVHFFKNFIWEMEKRGHSFLITARDKDVTIRLLQAYGFDFQVVGKIGRGKLNLIKEWIGRDWQIFKLARKFKPDVLTGISNPCASHVSRLIGAKSVIFNDTEHAKLGNRVTHPFAHVICTPSCFKKNLGRKQTRYNGYHELAYLHPNYFTPDPSIYSDLGLSPNQKFSVIRLVGWQAVHDIGQHGLSLKDKQRLVNTLGDFGKVFISSEQPLSPELEPYRLTLPSAKFHDVLYYASLCVSEGGSTASEAAVLGTPSIHVSTTAKYCGNFYELQDLYGLLYAFDVSAQAVDKAIELVNLPNVKNVWQAKRNVMLREKIDVTDFMVKYIEEIGAMK